METAKRIIEKRGRSAIMKAAEEVLDVGRQIEGVSHAAEYFVNVKLRRDSSIFPALLSLCCEAVGGDPEKTTSFGAALTLVAIAADIHDDIIDNSKVKYTKKTVFGKFGSDISILLGDALLVRGSLLLCKECGSLSKDRGETIQRLMFETFSKICAAETKETQLKGKLDTKPEEYLEVIRLKASVQELHCKIGAILGGADEETVDSFENYGRALGVISVIRDEFIDLLEFPELRNRIRNECVPIPVLYALQDPTVRNEISSLLEKPRLTKTGAEKIAKLVLHSEQIQELRKRMNSTMKTGLETVTTTHNALLSQELSILLKATTDGL